MRNLIGAALLAVLAMTSLSLAADGPPAAAAPQQSPQVTLKLSLETLNVIAKGLAELPLKEAAPVLNDINAQVQKELAPAEAGPKSKK